MSAPDDGSNAACYGIPLAPRLKVIICRCCGGLHAATQDCEPTTLHPDDQREQDAREECQ